MRSKPNVSPPVYVTSCLRPATSMRYYSLHPATHMHYFSCRSLTPSAEYHRNSVMWTKPTKIGYHGNVPSRIEKLVSD